MICEKCKEQGLNSVIFVAFWGSTTAMGYQTYYDENGQYHSHNPNATTKMAHCSNQHKMKILSNTKCPSCDYGKEVKIEYV